MCDDPTGLFAPNETADTLRARIRCLHADRERWRAKAEQAQNRAAVLEERVEQAMRVLAPKGER